MPNSMEEEEDQEECSLGRDVTDGSPPKRFKSTTVHDLLPISSLEAIENALFDRKPHGDLKVNGTDVYGRENDTERVIKLLISGVACSSSSNVSVIRIVGAGGVGKTTLANLVYSSPTVCEMFETRVWVRANERLDVRGLTKAIIESFGGISCCLTELTQIQDSLKEELMSKRFLIVLDNVCDDELNFWSSLLPPLVVGAKGSAIIATTRHVKKDMAMDMVQSYQLSRLSIMNCFSILQNNHAFGAKKICADPNWRSVAKQIIAKCDGLPLLVKALGFLLQTSDLSIWNEVLGSSLLNASATIPLSFDAWAAYKIERALSLSYGYLDQHMQQCFVYCSLFPKGYLFDKDHLVRLWVSSKDYIEKAEGKQEQDTADEYFDELVKRSFFQYYPTLDPSKENCYVMHDFFHDLAQYRSKGICFRAEDPHVFGIPESVLHISLAPCEFNTEIELGTFELYKDIHSLLIVNGSAMKWDGGLFHVYNLPKLENLFSHLICLRTLDLSFTDIEMVPESIANLQQLRYLALNRTKIRRLPHSICRLLKLQTLELQGCNYLSELPACINDLLELQNLLVWKESGFVLMPSGIGKLTCLRTLSTFIIGRDKQHCGINELRDLMNIRGALYIGGIENVVNEEEAKEAKMEMKELIETLTIQWRTGGEDLEDDQSAEVAYEVLVNLRPHNNLEELSIRDYYADQFPQWIADPSFSYLFSITFDNCCECSILPPLGQLPSLNHLSLRMMDGVQRIGHEFCGSGTSRGFPSLKTLKLWEMYVLEEWFIIGDEDFPRLRNLSISRCNKLKGLPCFTSLVELSIHSCAQLYHIPTLPRLKSLKIEGLHNLESLSQQLDLSALQILEISHCDKLVSIGCLSRIVFLKQLKVIKCPKLYFSQDVELPSKLQFVEIRHCNLLSNWHPNGFEEITNAPQVMRKLVRQVYHG